MSTSLRGEIMNNMKMLAQMGLLLGIIFILSLIESLLPPIPFLPPFVRLGLGNIAVMFCAINVGKRNALVLVILKSLFVLFTRGPVASILSLGGGLISVVFLILLISYHNEKYLSITALSILTAIMHNLGQLFTSAFILNIDGILYFLPLSLLFGIIMGFLTGTILRIVLPIIHIQVLNSTQD